MSLDKASPAFIQFHDNLKNSEIYSYKINFVSFNQGVIDNMEIINNFINKIKKESGVEIGFHDYNVKKITNIYEKLKRQNSISVLLPYKHLQQSYSNKNVESYVGLINGKDLVKSLDEVIGTIFDENIRLHEVKSKINEGIKQTAADEKDAIMFYLYNNGITFICDKANMSPSNLSIKLDGASIVNGCQTVTSLYELNKQEKLQDNVDILVRITKISDYDERSKITQFLNSQNQVKESYFIANHTIVRDLQSKLLEKKFFLERQINEASYKEKYIDDTVKRDFTIVKLDDVIQYYAGYYLDKFSATAKRNKNILFSNENIEEILSDITADKVIESYETYQKIAEIITSYRKQRRNKNHEEFAEIMGITNKELEDNEQKYLFMNTADILLLNTCKFMKKKYADLDLETRIIKSITLVSKLIGNNHELTLMPPAGVTKNQKIYTEVQNHFNKQ